MLKLKLNTMKDKPSFYSIIPASVRYDSELTPNAKLLYAEITSLLQMNGVCYASNKYFSELYGKNKGTISRWIKELKERAYIKVNYTYKNDSKEIASRYIQICVEGMHENEKGVYAKMLGGMHKNVKDNNTSNNINLTDSNTKASVSFKKPEVSDIKEYCLERKNNVDAETFFDFYESKGWLIGKNKMKSWKACVRTWEKSRNNKTNNNDRTTSHKHKGGVDYGDGSF